MLHRKKLARTSHKVQVDYARLSRDQVSFLAIFVLKVALGLVAFTIKPWLGILFLAAYAAYVWREIKEADTSSDEEDLEPLKFRPIQPNRH